jgi:hypothetical protein
LKKKRHTLNEIILESKKVQASEDKAGHMYAQLFCIKVHNIPNIEKLNFLSLFERDTIRYGDQVSIRIFRANQSLNPVAYVQQAEEKMLQFCFVPGKYRVGMPLTPSLTV